jgi:hypothetical protein
VDKPLPSHPDLDALAAGVVATPNDIAVWTPYIDRCIELGRDEWADLARQYWAADDEWRRNILERSFGKWDLGDALTWDAFTRAADFAMSEAGQAKDSVGSIDAFPMLSREHLESVRQDAERMANQFAENPLPSDPPRGTTNPPVD